MTKQVMTEQVAPEQVTTPQVSGRPRAILRSEPASAARGFMHSRRSERGFTLIELMVVIVILGLLLGVVVPNVFKSLRGATRDTAMNQMHSFGGAIDLYRLQNKSLPKSLDELTEPDPKTGDAFMDKIPNDPWGEPYDYKVINAGKGEYEITSAGEDKAFGTADDLTFPEREEK